MQDSLTAAARFLSFSDIELEKTLRWLELPHHHVVFADSERYPQQLRATEDYPGLLFIVGDPDCLHSFQVAVVGSRQHSGMENAGGDYSVRSLPLAV